MLGWVRRAEGKGGVLTITYLVSGMAVVLRPSTLAPLMENVGFTRARQILFPPRAKRRESLSISIYLLLVLSTRLSRFPSFPPSLILPKQP